ncbi:FAD-binding and (Fe-S)-binding domain-containing protein [Humibacter albus]|uniref:FAD-binding and (Fe-S)-binding domain-containing protein n=1 Tax=Humibacter albus TaxID=427754 RepID=UPI0003B72A94|nr:FAD-binding and (Fe-S)-binding domain-containing protein [Humibacter albus]
MTITNGGLDIHGLLRELESVDADIRFDDGARAAYSTDASNYRHVPIGVVLPRSVDAGAEVVRACSDFDVPVLSRGGGTSLAGQACNEGVVIDWSKYCDGLVEVSRASRTAVVETGLVLDELNREVAALGLMFGPKPATHSHCTLGGMIGNNSCGSSAQKYGKTADNVRALEILTYGGERMWVRRDDDVDKVIAEGGAKGRLYAGLRAIIAQYGDEVRRKFPRIPRRVSGFNLDALLPENGFDVPALLVGSESTLVTVLRAELDLVEMPKARAFVVLGYPTIEDAADAAPAAAPFGPLAIEGIDATLVDFERTKRKNLDALGLLPDGGGYLIIEVPGETKDDADATADAMIRAMEQRGIRPDVRRLDDEAQQEGVLRVREAGLGAATNVPGLPDMWSGWEDSAVPPERFGDYLRDLRDLLGRYDYEPVARYGHFGHGCLHMRIPFPLDRGPAGVDEYRRFTHEAAELVVHYGGSFSGEHGDGQARADLLPTLYGERIVEAFQRLKSLFDPRARMNPGKMVDPQPRTEGLRLGAGYAPRQTVQLHFSYPHDDGRFSAAALRCVGVGNCRSHGDGVMCPSYRATGEEEHSTRGRARLLFEMIEGTYRTNRDTPVDKGWRSPEVKDALDLCLSCKGCKSDCPVDVDMATYKAEFLSHYYERRLRPTGHYSMGWLTLWARIAHLAPPIVNAISHAPGVGALAKRVAGMEPHRPAPRFVHRRFTDSARASAHGVEEVVLFADTFGDNFQPSVLEAATVVLEDAGYRVRVPRRRSCCGLTLISTGQLTAATTMLKSTAAHLAAELTTGERLVVLEPSCLAVFRSDGPELLPDDPNIQTLKDRAVTLAELLASTEGWTPPQVGGRAIVQEHCHQHAVLGFDAERSILREAGVEFQELDGCCGLAGNFGFESGHLPVSVAVADHSMLPTLRHAADGTRVVADGFSCRTQADQLGDGPRALHLAEVLASALPGGFRPRRTRRDTVPRSVQTAAMATLKGRKS